MDLGFLALLLRRSSDVFNIASQAGVFWHVGLPRLLNAHMFWMNGCVSGGSDPLLKRLRGDAKTRS